VAARLAISSFAPGFLSIAIVAELRFIKASRSATTPRESPGAAASPILPAQPERPINARTRNNLAGGTVAKLRSAGARASGLGFPTGLLDLITLHPLAGPSMGFQFCDSGLI